MKEISVKVVSCWPTTMGDVIMSTRQRKLLEQGKTPYRRDEVIEKYEFNKGKWV